MCSRLNIQSRMLHTDLLRQRFLAHRLECKDGIRVILPISAAVTNWSVSGGGAEINARAFLTAG